MRVREAAALWPELRRVLAMMVPVDRDWRRLGTRPAVLRARARGCRAPTRDSAARARLRRAVAAVDARWPGGPNCLRRALLEASLDAAAAREPILLHLDASGGRGSGHARLASVPEDGRSYDATFAL
jgi:Mg-chelatase subunit ChlD